MITFSLCSLVFLFTFFIGVYVFTIYKECKDEVDFRALSDEALTTGLFSGLLSTFFAFWLISVFMSLSAEESAMIDPLKGGVAFQKPTSARKKSEFKKPTVPEKKAMEFLYSAAAVNQKVLQPFGDLKFSIPPIPHLIV